MICVIHHIRYVSISDRSIRMQLYCSSLELIGIEYDGICVVYIKSIVEVTFKLKNKQQVETPYNVLRNVNEFDNLIECDFVFYTLWPHLLHNRIHHFYCCINKPMTKQMLWSKFLREFFNFRCRRKFRWILCNFGRWLISMLFNILSRLEKTEKINTKPGIHFLTHQSSDSINAHRKQAFTDIYQSTASRLLDFSLELEHILKIKTQRSYFEWIHS